MGCETGLGILGFFGWIIIIAIDVIIGLLTAGVADEKGYPAKGWFFMGLILSIFGLFIAGACLPNLNEYMTNNANTYSDNVEMWQCANCKTVNYGGLFCKKCGKTKGIKDMVQKEKKEDDNTFRIVNGLKKTTGNAVTKKWTCECGQENRMEAKACINCGKARP